MQKKHGGFTIMEMLIVVAIIAVLTSVAIPTFNGSLEKSREATDLANVRAAYAEVMAAALLDDQTDMVKTVPLKQKQDGWQSADPITIGGISHAASDRDTPNWKGNPVADGTCEVSYHAETGILFDWKGGSGSGAGTETKQYFFNVNENVQSALEQSGWIKKLAATGNRNFEIDSRCPNSEMVPDVKKYINEDSLLNTGTWAYIGDSKVDANRALLWTSVNTNDVGHGKKIPVIVSTADGRYYLTETTTGLRKNTDGNYVAVSDHLGRDGVTQLYDENKRYASLKDAYDAYEKELTKGKYTQYKDTLPQSK